MSDLLSEIFKKYGTAAIVIALLASLSIWGLAHWAASPGSEVSVLWGLVKYTKSGVSAQQPVLDETTSPAITERKVPATSDTTKLKDVLQPVTIDVESRVPGNKALQVVKTLRTKYGLRELNAFESGKKVSELPSGTFFFTLLTWISDSYSKGIAEHIQSLEAFRYKTYYSNIELHLIDNQDLRIVGFTSDTHAASISHLSGESSHSILLSGTAWGSMTNLVSIPVNRIQSSRPREIQASSEETHSILELSIK